MRSYAEIAQETGTDIRQVRHAMACAERSRDTFHGTYSEWYVCAVGYGEWLDSYAHAEGYGGTREKAVIDALNRHPGMFR